MEVVKVNNTVTEYRSYEWNGYTPLGMMVKAKNGSGTFETNTYQFITNHRGDVLSIRDKDDQEVGAYTYDAYGNVLTVEGDLAKANPIRYAGYYYDDETKNYYLQARYYNPKNGAFLALDPHPGDDDEPLSQNGYSYANGNPVMNVDPDGERAKAIKTGGKWVWNKGKKMWQSTKNFFKPKRVTTNIRSLNGKSKKHILEPKHNWHKVTKNPDEFGSVSKIMMKVIKKGKHSKYKSVNKATMKIQGQTVVVTYKRVGDKLLISNAWVAR